MRSIKDTAFMDPMTETAFKRVLSGIHGPGWNQSSPPYIFATPPASNQTETGPDASSTKATTATTEVDDKIPAAAFEPQKAASINDRNFSLLVSDDAPAAAKAAGELLSRIAASVLMDEDIKTYIQNAGIETQANNWRKNLKTLKKFGGAKPIFASKGKEELISHCMSQGRLGSLAAPPYNRQGRSHSNPVAG